MTNGKNNFKTKIGPREIVEITDIRGKLPVRGSSIHEMNYEDLQTLLSLQALLTWMESRHLEADFELTDE